VFLAPVSPDLPVLDPKTVDNLRVLAGANRPGEDILAEFVALFARDAVTRVVLIRDGWQRGQPQAVWDAAHALKGSAATLGAVRVHALAEAIDRIAKPIAKSGATTLPMTASDAAMVDQLVDEVAVAIDRMHTDFLGRPAPSR
jgi:HPt (histidine-containing phosphotransfer) domain-containing protein